MRLTGRKHPALTTVATTVVLVATTALAARSGAVDPLAGPVSLDSGADSRPSIFDRAIHVPAVSVGQAQVQHAKGTPALPPSALSHLDIPPIALLAYQTAATVMDEVDKSCGLSWTLLAAIGRVESDHGRYGGSTLLTDGTASPEIRGPALDGHGSFAKVPDTDAGKLDGDTVWDRAVGPMQFLPSTWAVVGVDADADGVRSPNDINDAALAAGVFLCSAPGTLDTRTGLRTAIYRYNPSDAYVASVLAVERSYRSGKFDIPGAMVQTGPVTTIASTRSPSPSPAGQTGQAAGTGQPGAPKPGHQVGVGHQSSQPTNHPSHGSTGGSGTGQTDPSSPGSTDPSPTDPTDPPSTDPTDPPTSTTPTPTPDPTPDPPPSPDPSDPPPSPDPSPVSLTGVLAACGTDQTSWCLGDQLLDVGDADYLAAPALADFDGDDAVESNTAELTGLAGTDVTVTAAPGTDPAVVLSIDGLAYRP